MGTCVVSYLRYFCALSFLASTHVVNPFYIMPSHSRLLRASWSCLSIHWRYAFESENASSPNKL